MKVYQTNELGYFTNETVADPNPRNPGRFLIPYGCVETPPPELGEHQVARYVDGEWIVVPFYVGYQYWTEDGKRFVIKEVGEEPPEGHLTSKPVILDEVKNALILNVSKHMDVIAGSWGYDSMAVAITYAEEPAVPKYQNEGKALRAWRSLLWESAFEELNSVTVNTSVDEFMARLPEPPVRPE